MRNAFGFFDAAGHPAAVYDGGAFPGGWEPATWAGHPLDGTEELRVMSTRVDRSAALRWLVTAAAVSVPGLSLVPRAACAAESPGPEPARLHGVERMPLAVVRPGKLKVRIHERGRLEAAMARDVDSQVEGRTTILALVPEGTLVKKGQVVCELDSSLLKDRLTNQGIVADGAKNLYIAAKLEREIAEAAAGDYTKLSFPRELTAARAEVAAAQAAVASAERRLERTKRTRQRLSAALGPGGGAKTTPDLLAELDLDDRIADAEQALLRARQALELAGMKRQHLEEHTRVRTLHELNGAVVKARSLEEARQHAWDLELNKQKKIEHQIARCRIEAPADGVLVYAHDPVQPGQTEIAEGASVRERQRIFRVFAADGPLQVSAKVRESSVAQLKVGMHAQVRVDALAGKLLGGTVRGVHPLPDPTTDRAGVPKVYTTIVSIDEPRPALRPGMTAYIQVLGDELDQVLTVPLGAVLRFDGKDYVAVRTSASGFAWRPVELGLSDGQVAEVRQGLESGESVILTPRALLAGPRTADAK
jgi:multidrug efflux pump subunit AcrA (membrane-fusion protein)